MPSLVTLLSTISGSATGGAYPGYGDGTSPIKFMASIAGTGGVTATVVIEATNTPLVAASWVTGVTFALSGTTTDVGQYVTAANWPYVRARTTAISGTNATVTVTMGV